MIWPFTKNTASQNHVLDVYDAIVAQSRQETFYADWDVPDTVTGRFNMICLHLALVFRRLRPQSGGDREFAQALFDAFFKDMDRSLREMGISDVAVPKRIQKMGALFYGLLDKITEALDKNDKTALASALRRNIYEEGNEKAAEELADYALRLAARLNSQDPAAIEAGQVDFGDGDERP